MPLPFYIICIRNLHCASLGRKEEGISYTVLTFTSSHYKSPSIAGIGLAIFFLIKGKQREKLLKVQPLNWITIGGRARYIKPPTWLVIANLHSMDLVLSQQLARGSPSQDTVEMGLAGWEAHEQARHSSGQKTEFEYSKLHLVSSFTPTPPPPPQAEHYFGASSDVWNDGGGLRRRVVIGYLNACDHLWPYNTLNILEGLGVGRGARRPRVLSWIFV